MTKQRAALLVIAGGAINATLSLLSAIWPAQVAGDRASYPFTPGVQIGFEVIFALAHLLVAIGLFVLARSWAPRVARAGGCVMALAFGVFAIGELVEASQAHASADHADSLLALFFGPASLLYGIAALVAGFVLMRALPRSPVASAVLVSGIALMALVLPTQFGADRRVTDVALALWFVSVAWIGQREQSVGSRQYQASDIRQTTLTADG